MLELGAGGPAPALPLSSSLWGHIRDPQAQCVNTWQESALGLGYQDQPGQKARAARLWGRRGQPWLLP